MVFLVFKKNSSMHRLSSGAAGTLEALSPSPVNIRRRRTRACQTNTRVSNDEKNFTVLAAAILSHGWCFSFSFRSISILSILLQMSVCDVS